MKEILKRLLLQIVDMLDAGTCNMSEDEICEVINYAQSIVDGNNRVSKYDACQQLGISRATFDNYVRLGLIPRGRHARGFKELSWTQYDIDKANEAIERYKRNT